MALGKNEEILAALIKMADQLDQEDKAELASEIDNTLESLAARPKAPLKNLSPDVKKSLLTFLYKANKNIADSVSGLSELFSRLRYFDVAYIIEDMDLDKTAADMRALQSDLNLAVNKFYEVTHGKRPSKGGVEALVNDAKDAEQNPQEFFEAQSKPAEISESDLFSRDEKGERVPHGIDKTIKCEDCGEDMKAKVLKSGGGYYIGRMCQCGPYSRDSRYFKTEEDAQRYLDSFLSNKEMPAEDEPELEHCEQCAEDCAGDCYCHDELGEQEVESFWK